MCISIRRLPIRSALVSNYQADVTSFYQQISSRKLTRKEETLNDKITSRQFDRWKQVFVFLYNEAKKVHLLDAHKRIFKLSPL